MRLGYILSDSVKCKGVSCEQGIKYAAQNRQKRGFPTIDRVAAAFIRKDFFLIKLHNLIAGEISVREGEAHCAANRCARWSRMA